MCNSMQPLNENQCKTILTSQFCKVRNKGRAHKTHFVRLVFRDSVSEMQRYCFGKFRDDRERQKSLPDGTRWDILATKALSLKRRLSHKHTSFVAPGRMTEHLLSAFQQRNLWTKPEYKAMQLFCVCGPNFSLIFLQHPGQTSPAPTCITLPITMEHREIGDTNTSFE